MKKNVLIKGPILTQSGYGEHARFIYRALKTREDLFEVFVDPIRWGQTSWLWEDDEERQQIDQDITKTAIHGNQGGQYDASLLVTIPSEWEAYRAAPINIGVTAGIEANKVSLNWVHAANNFVNKIIVPSSFSKKVYEETQYVSRHPDAGERRIKTETPIVSINYPVKI